MVARALFQRLPRLADLVPFVELADGLPTPVERLGDNLWVKRDERTSSLYGGNKVRKFEFLFSVAARRGGPLVTAGGIGSHHVVAAAAHAATLGLEVQAVLYPQPRTDDVAATQAELARLGVATTRVSSPYLMPVGLAARLATLAHRRPYLLWPGASTPLGTLGYVSAALELIESFATAGWSEPDSVVVALGSGGTAVGMAVGLQLGGWRRARVIAVRAADLTVTNRAVVGALEVAASGVLGLGGWRPRPARLSIDGRWLGGGYGHPTDAGRAAERAGAKLGVMLEPTYTAKAFAAALERSRRGDRVVFVQTYACES